MEGKQMTSAAARVVANSNDEAALDRHRGISLFRRFGWHATLALLAGTALILGCAALICFLFLSDSNNWIWSRIVLNGWIPRTITIVALILRWAVTAQAIACTAMIAALYLSAFSTPLSSAAAISLTRFSNTGPLSLLPYVPCGLSRSSLLGLITALLAAVTTLLQFTSTALLSNVGEGTIIQYESISQLAYGTSPGALVAMQGDSTSAIGTRPSNFPSFAEYSEPADTEGDDGIDDTGTSIRGFLPIGSEELRNRLVSYSGNATIIDTRAVCVRPEITNFTLNGGYNEMLGNISTKLLPSRFNRSSTTSTRFNCTFATQGLFSDQVATTHEWPLTLCPVEVTNIYPISIMDPLITPPMTLASTGYAWLLINTTGSLSDWKLFSGDIPLTMATNNGQWLHLWEPNSAVSIHMTLCYMSLKAQDTNIEVLREPQNFQEPTYGWDGKTGMFETLSIRQHFNAVSPALAPDARDIFAMSNKTSWERPPSLEYHNNGTATSVNSPTVPEILGSYALSGLEAGFDPTAFLCGYCQPGGKIQTNRLHSAIFNDILQSTKSPALALQTFATTLWGLSYYNSLFQFDTYGPAEVVNQVPVIKPTGRSFFYAVIGLLALHVILIVFITTLYIVVARNSLIGNAWSASAQLRGDETREWIEKASYMTDKEVKKAIEADGKGLVTIGVGKMDVRLRQRYSEAQ